MMLQQYEDKLRIVSLSWVEVKLGRGVEADVNVLFMSFGRNVKVEEM